MEVALGVTENVMSLIFNNKYTFKSIKGNWEI